MYVDATAPPEWSTEPDLWGELQGYETRRAARHTWMEEHRDEWPLDPLETLLSELDVWDEVNARHRSQWRWWAKGTSTRWR